MNAFKPFLLSVLVLLSSSSFSLAQSTSNQAKGNQAKGPPAKVQSLTGMWFGTYYYPARANKKPVKFQLILIQENLKVAGYIKEPNTFGAADDPWLQAEVVGQFNPRSREFTLSKMHDGTGKVFHKINYSGRLSANGSSIQNGKWVIPNDWSGQFTLEKMNRSRSGRCAGIWAGTYDYQADSGQKTVHFQLIMVHQAKNITGLIKEPNTFGEEKKPWLYGVAQGQFNDDTRELKYVKTYDATAKVDHEVLYTARLSKDGTKVINGRWQITKDWGGTFTLRKMTVAQFVQQATARK